MFNFKQGFYADVRIEDRCNTTISYLNEQLRESKITTIKRAFIRVYDGKMWYYTSTCETDRIQEELEKLYLCATHNKDIEEDKIVKLFEVNREQKMMFEQNNVRAIPLEKKNELALSGMKYFKDAPYLKALSTAYLDRNNVVEFYSSKGASIKYDWQICTVVYSGAMSKESVAINCNVRSCKTAFNELNIDAEEFTSKIEEVKNFLENAKPCQKGEFPVVLAPVVTGVFAHESFGHNSEADSMLGDESMKDSWKIGEKVGESFLSIYDDGTDIGSGYTPFDDEGTRARRNYLIKDGILAGRLHGAVTAAALDEQLTGNCRAINASYEPIVRMTSTMIEGGDKTVEQLIGNIKFGYYVKDYKHGSGLSTFTIAPTFSYEIVDGKIGDPVYISVITGNVFKTLALIDGVANDKTTISSATGGCGKMWQSPLSVSFGGPHISVSKMTIQ